MATQAEHGLQYWPIFLLAGWLRGRSVDRELANWEPLVVVAARIRERLGIPGMSVETVRGFRDKQLMKDRVAAAGLRVPLAQRARSVKDVWSALEAIGFPAIIKPISGAGSADTYKVESASAMERVLPHMGHVVEAICEEFIDGEEYTYDTASIDGRPATRASPATCRTRSRYAPTSGSPRSYCRCATSISATSAAESSWAAPCCSPSAWATVPVGVVAPRAA